MNHVTQAEFARICGVNRSTVTRWLQAGRIEATPQGLIDPTAAQRMREATESPAPHHQARKEQIEAEKAARGAFFDAAGMDGMDNAQKTPQTPNTPPVAGATPAATPAAPGAAMPSAEKLGVALKLETYKLQKAKAERENIELDVRAGALVERAEVDYLLADIGNTIRAILENLPDRMAASVAAARGDIAATHRAIEEAARMALAEIAENITRKAHKNDDQNP